MNPAALKTNVGDLPTGGALIVNSDAFTQQNLNKAGYTTNPLDDGSLKPYTRLRGPISTLNAARARRARHDLEAEGPDEELLRPGPDVLAVRARARSDARAGSTRSSSPAGHRGGQPAALKAGYNFGETTEMFHTTTACQGGARARASTATSPATRPRRWVPRRRRARGRHAVLRLYPITPAWTSSTALGYKTSACKTFQAEDEIAAIGAAIGASYGGALGMTATSRPRHRAQGRSHRPGGHGRAAARGHRRAARRPLHRDADQERAGRPAAGAVRSEQRLARCRSWPRPRPADCFDVRDRGVAHRAQVPDPGRLPVRRVTSPTAPSHGDPGARGPAGHLGPNAAQGDGHFRPYARDPETLARPGRSPARRSEHRIGGLEKADITGNVNYDPDNHRSDAAPARPKSRASPTTSRRSRSSADEGDLLVSAGVAPTARMPRAVERAAAQGQRWRTRTSATSTRSRATSRTPECFKKVLVPELNRGQLRCSCGPASSRRGGCNKVHGKPFRSRGRERRRVLLAEKGFRYRHVSTDRSE